MQQGEFGLAEKALSSFKSNAARLSQRLSENVSGKRMHSYICDMGRAAREPNDSVFEIHLSRGMGARMDELICMSHS